MSEQFQAYQIGKSDDGQRCALDANGKTLLDEAIERLALSHRARQRVMRVARTCADLEGAPVVRVDHLAEALAYRCLHRRLAF